jgi:hypothetical protein
MRGLHSVPFARADYTATRTVGVIQQVAYYKVSETKNAKHAANGEHA